MTMTLFIGAGGFLPSYGGLCDCVIGGGNYGNGPGGETSSWGIFNKLVNSSKWRAILLVFLIFWAGLTGWASQSQLAIRVAALTILFLLVALTTAVIHLAKAVEPIFIIVTATALTLNALLSIPLMHVSLIITSAKLITIAFILPYLALALKQKDTMHTVIATVIVEPGLIGPALSSFLSCSIRFTLCLPTFYFITYKITVHYLYIESPVAAKPMLFGFTIMILIGATLLAAIASLNLRNFPYCYLGCFGFSCFVTGGIFWNAHLATLRWKESWTPVDKGVLKRRIFYLISIVAAMTSNIVYFAMILCTIALIIATNWLRASKVVVIPSNNATNSTTFHDTNRSLGATLSYSNLVCFLMLGYFIMSSLVKTDSGAKEAQVAEILKAKEDGLDINLQIDKDPSEKHDDKIFFVDDCCGMSECSEGGDCPKAITLYLPD